MDPLSPYRDRLLNIVDRPAVLKRLDQPVRLASGALSKAFIDGKRAVAHPDDLDYVGRAMVAAARGAGATFDAVGGLVLGAVPFTFAVANHARCQWFMIRKEPKGRGTNQWAEGAVIEPGMRVMIVDDIITTGGSIRDAYTRVVEQGAQVVFATTLVDRGERAKPFFAAEGVPYQPLLTYRDLGIDSLDDELRAAAVAAT